LACICVILPLAIMAGCSEDEETITFPTPPEEIIAAVMLDVIAHVASQEDENSSSETMQAGPAKTTAIDAGDDLTMVVLQAQ